MVEQIRVQQLTTREQKQDCGCGCGGNSCGAVQQELILVSLAQATEMRRKAAGNTCDCGCSCCSD